jgi:hypothetical protein
MGEHRMQWTEERQGATRLLSVHTPCGYTARINVASGGVSAWLWRPPEPEHGYALSREGSAPTDIEAEVRRLMEELESRLEELEDGHS